MVRRPRRNESGRLVWLEPGQPMPYLSHCRWCGARQQSSATRVFSCPDCDVPELTVADLDEYG
jgi:hypothetical protein